MTDERNMYSTHKKPTYHQCKQHEYYLVTIGLKDGRTINGIIVDVRDDQVKVLVSEEVSAGGGDQRQFGFGRFGFRRFRPAFFPLAALTSLALLPYLAPYPYAYGPYGYPYYY